jgi:O-antigen ligase
MRRRPWASAWRVVLPAALGLGIGVVAGLSPVAAVALTGACVLGLLVLTRAEALLLVLMAAIPWESMLEYPTSTVTTVKLLGLAIGAGWLIRALAGRAPVRSTPVMVPLAVFAIALAVSLIASPDPGAGVSKLVRYALFLTFFFLIVQLADDREDVRRILRVLTFSSAVAAAYALYGFLIAGETERAAGPMDDPNDFAFLLASTLPFAAHFVVTDRWRRPLWIAAFVLIAAGILATLSRGALVGLGGIVVWGVVTRRVPLRAVVLGAAAMTAIAALALAVWAPVVEERLASKATVAEANAAARAELWGAAVRMAADRPLTGVGPDRFPDEASDYARTMPVALANPVTHNAYLEILAEAGAVALLCFLAFLWMSWAALARARREVEAAGDVDGRRLVTATQAALIVALLAGAFISAQVITVYWTLGAVGAVLARRASRRSGRLAREAVVLPRRRADVAAPV